MHLVLRFTALGHSQMVGDKETLKYYEMVCLSLITSLLRSNHTSRADQELQASEEKRANSTHSLPRNRLWDLKSLKQRWQTHCLHPEHWVPSLRSLLTGQSDSLVDITSELENFMPNEPVVKQSYHSVRRKTGCASVVAYTNICLSVQTCHETQAPWCHSCAHTHTPC